MSKWLLPLVLASTLVAAQVFASDSEFVRTSANGTKLPAGTAAVTARVWCYDAGHASLAGQLGIVDVVKAVRPKPFGEWNIIYYNPKQTTPNSILRHLQATRCPQAELVEDRVHKEGDLKLILKNPLVAYGDCFHFIVELPKERELQVSATLPSEWKLSTPGTLKHGSRFDVQSSRNSKPGKYEITLQLKQAEGESTLVLPVTLVHRVKPKGR